MPETWSGHSTLVKQPIFFNTLAITRRYSIRTANLTLLRFVKKRANIWSAQR
jgi:hypothetical protein